MNLIRLLAIAAIIWLCYRIYQNWLEAKSAAEKKHKKDTVENMVQCDKCGVHIPQQEALRSGDKFYCSEAHKQ